MNTAWKFKAITLVASLVGVLWAISSLQKGSVETGFKNIGIIPMNEANGAEKPEKPKKSANKTEKKENVISVTHDEAGAGANDDNHLAWCETRVKSLETKSGIKIEQEGKDWFVVKPQKKAIDTLTMEKWLGKHCKLVITDSRPPTFVPTNNVEMLSVGFINGETSKFTLTPEGFYFWDGLRFRSKQFKEAMDQLAKVANGETL